MKKITDISQIYNSCLREYMTGVDRSNREYKTQEVYTPDDMCDLMLDEIQEHKEINSVCLDRAVGDGQFAAKVLIAKIGHRTSHGMDIHDAFVSSLDEIFGVDIEKENVELCRQRLLCGCTDKKIINLVKRRIIVGDCLNPNKKIQGQTDNDHLLMKKYFGKPELFKENTLIKAFGTERTLTDHVIFLTASNSIAFVKKNREDITKVLQAVIIALSK